MRVVVGHWPVRLSFSRDRYPRMGLGPGVVFPLRRYW
jgi:hypothetical protein